MLTESRFHVRKRARFISGVKQEHSYAATAEQKREKDKGETSQRDHDLPLARDPAKKPRFRRHVHG